VFVDIEGGIRKTFLVGVFAFEAKSAGLASVN